MPEDPGSRKTADKAGPVAITWASLTSEPGGTGDARWKRLDLSARRPSFPTMFFKSRRRMGAPWLRVGLVAGVACFSQVYPYVQHLHTHHDHAHALEVNCGPSPDPVQVIHGDPDGHDHELLIGVADRPGTRTSTRLVWLQADFVCMHGGSDDSDPGTAFAGVAVENTSLPPPITRAAFGSRGPPVTA